MIEFLRTGLMGFPNRDQELIESSSHRQRIVPSFFTIDARPEQYELHGLAVLVVVADERPLLAVSQCGRARAVAPELPVVLLGQEEAEFEAAARHVGAACVLSRPKGEGVPWEALRQLLRNTGPRSPNQDTITVSDRVVIDRRGRRLYVDGEERQLSSAKFDMLSYFIEHAGRAISARECASRGLLSTSQIRRFRSIILELRNQLGTARQLIRAVPGYGYRVDLGTPSHSAPDPLRTT